MTLFNKRENDGGSEQQANTETLGARISAARKRKGYTQEEFSDMLGVTPQAVSKWENDLSCPDILALPKISELLGISIDELLTGKTENKTQEETQSAVPSIITQSNAKTENLKLRIKVSPPNKKPVKISLPLSVAKRIATIDCGISGIIGGHTTLDDDKMNQIMNLIENGASGEIINITAEDDTNIIIEIS